MSYSTPQPNMFHPHIVILLHPYFTVILLERKEETSDGYDGGAVEEILGGLKSNTTVNHFIKLIYITPVRSHPSIQTKESSSSVPPRPH
ncbi:hypothetical protein K1719_005391 [Acacia pycnantha]|nr:hypothetical protein K1719_005391 [Acacia pycnantha]